MSDENPKLKQKFHYKNGKMYMDGQMVDHISRHDVGDESARLLAHVIGEDGKKMDVTIDDADFGVLTSMGVPFFSY